MSASGGRIVRAEVTEDPVDPEALAAAVAGPARGAVVTFAGVVRDHDTPGRGRVVRLDYEAHPDAGRVMREVCEDLAAAHAAVVVAAVHRVGSLVVGEPALVVVVASAHRSEAFRAAADLVDAVKARVPVWKHQVFEDGSDEWVGLGSAAPVHG